MCFGTAPLSTCIKPVVQVAKFKFPHGKNPRDFVCSDRIIGAVHLFYMNALVNTFFQAFIWIKTLGWHATWHLFSTCSQTCLNTRYLNQNQLSGPIPAQISELTAIEILYAFFTWIHLVNTFFQGKYNRMTCSMAPFINTYSNLFALQATPVKQVKRSPSSANFSVDCITVAVRLFYMETLVNQKNLG